MPVDPQLRALMQQEFTWRPRTGQDAWQKRTYGAPETLEGVMEEKVHSITDDNGQKIECHAIIYLADVYGVKPGDEISLAGEESHGEIRGVDDYPHPLTGEDYGSVVHLG